MKVARH